MTSFQLTLGFLYYSMHIYLKATLIKNYIGTNLYNNGNKKVNIYIYVYILRIKLLLYFIICLYPYTLINRLETLMPALYVLLTLFSLPVIKSCHHCLLKHFPIFNFSQSYYKKLRPGPLFCMD